MEEDQELERKAVEELLKEAKRGKTRAETMGPMGWMKCPLNTLPSHKEQDYKQKEDSKEPAKSQSQKEEGRRQKHQSHPYKPIVHALRSPPGERGKRGGHEKSQTRSSKR
uniref:DNA-directed RNA polymerases I and III subunit RPAC2 n=1 Tax=Capra hircus TaxID=9925 RepID=A0A452GBE3_CAPHI